MSAIGKGCLFCAEPIVLQAEASGCLRCGSVFHRECAVVADDKCPQCKDQIDYAERMYRYSARCPDCLAANEPRASRCVKCGAWTRWADEEEYQNNLVAHRKRCRGVIQGALLKAAGLIALCPLLGLLTGFGMLWLAAVAVALGGVGMQVSQMLSASRRLEFE